MRWLYILALYCAFAQEPPPVNPQRAAAARQRETARRQAELAGATLLPATESAEPSCEPLPATEIEPMIAAAAKTHELKPELLRAVIARESAFRPCAISAKG